VRRISFRSNAAAFVFAIVLATLLTNAAAGFTCVPRDPRDLARAAQVVVAGVIETESAFGMRVRVTNVYMGRAEQTITVLPGQGNANRVGTPYVFYLGRDLVAYHHADCGGSHASSLTPDEVALFGDGTSPTPDAQFLGPLGNTLALAIGMVALLLFGRRRGRRPPLSPLPAHP
jgi:hypothetical protein